MTEPPPIHWSDSPPPVSVEMPGKVMRFSGSGEHLSAVLEDGRVIPIAKLFAEAPAKPDA